MEIWNGSHKYCWRYRRYRFCPQTDRWTDGQTDRWTRWNQYTPLSTSLKRGYNNNLWISTDIYFTSVVVLETTSWYLKHLIYFLFQLGWCGQWVGINGSLPGFASWPISLLKSLLLDTHFLTWLAIPPTEIHLKMSICEMLAILFRPHNVILS